jgi:Flp pilus assembly protein TadG
MHGRRDERGQAAIELVALLPVLALVVLLVWQISAAGHTWIVAQSAARAGSRAAEVGAPARDAARAVMPRSSGRPIRVTESTVKGSRRVVVSARAPTFLPGVETRFRIEAQARVDE